MPLLNDRSLKNLQGVHPKMVAVVKLAASMTPWPIVVTEGVRTAERQKELYAQGRSKPGKIVTWTLKSKHFKAADGFGHAVDIYPAPGGSANVNAPLSMFDTLNNAMMTAAARYGVRLRWGANWDGDNQIREKGETDNPHWEMV